MKYSILKKIYKKKLLFFSLVSFLFGIEYFLGPYGYIKIADNVDNTIPAYIAISNQLFESGFSRMNSFLLGGIDRFASGFSYTKISYILFLLLPGWLAYQLMVFAAFMFPGYFTYRISKEYADLNESTSILSGVISVFLYGYFDIMNDIGYNLAWYLLPMFIYYIEDFIRKGRSIYYFLFLGVLNQFFTSAAHTFLHTSIAITIWFLIARPQRSTKFWFSLFGFFCVSAFLEMPTVISILSSAEHSIRSELLSIRLQTGFDESLLNYKWLINISPFQGRYSLLLLSLLIVFVLSGLKDKQFNRLVVFMAIVLSLSLIDIGKIYIPFLHSLLTQFTFYRIWFTLPFTFSILIAYSYEYLSDITIKSGKRDVKLLIPLSYVYLLFLVIFFAKPVFDTKKDHLKQWVLWGNFKYIFQNERIKTFSENTSQEEPFRVAAIYFRMHAGHLQGYNLETSDGYSPVFPKWYKDFWLTLIEPLKKNDPALYNGYMNKGFATCLYPPTNIQTNPNELIFNDHFRLNLLSLANTKYLFSRLPLIDENLVPLYDNDKFIYNRGKRERYIEYLRQRFIADGSDIYIYENLNSLPRYYVASNIKTFESKEELLDSMASASIDEFKQNIFLEKKILDNIETTEFSSSEYQIELLANEPDSIHLTVKVDAPGILVVLNSYNPNWRAKVNGNEVKVLRIYHAFCGVTLDKGENSVSLDYEPNYSLGNLF